MKKLLATFLTATTALILSVSSSAQAAWNESTLETVVESLNVFWSAFLDGNIEYHLPTVYVYAGAENTPCGPLEVAHYCLSTNTVHLDVKALSNLASSIGDSAAYVVVAHEYAHSVQYQLGLYSLGASNMALELQADCLAGTFFAAADYAGMLETGDFGEGYAAAFVSGDSDFEGSNHHGSPVQRSTAFASGFSNAHYCF